jgi:restriction endonuclease Mrr
MPRRSRCWCRRSGWGGGSRPPATTTLLFCDIAFAQDFAVAIPDYQSLMLPVLLAASKNEVRIGDVVEQLAVQLGLTSEERAELLPSGKMTLFANRVHWAKLYLVKAELLESTRRGNLKSLNNLLDGQTKK